MNKLSKILSFLLVAAMLISLIVSCGDGSSVTTPEETTQATGETTTPVDTTKIETTEAPNVTEAPDASVNESITEAEGETGTAITDESSSNTEPESTEPEATQPQIEETEPEEESSVIENLEELIPPELNLGRNMTIFASQLYYDEWLKEDEGDIVGTEIYNRVPRVEANLGIELSVDTAPGDSSHLSEIREEIAKRQESTDPNMIADLCSTYSALAGVLTLEGRYQNIDNSSYIDLSNPWWPKDLLENSIIDDKIYFVSGDISPTLIYETYAIFYNLDLIERYHLEDPITMVNQKKWTLDNLITMTSGIYEDTDHSTKGPSNGDFFAFNFNDNAHIKAFPFAMGVRVIVPDSELGYVFSESYYGSKMETIADKMVDWIDNNPGVKTAKDFNDYGKCFINHQAIFTVGNFAFAAVYLAGSGVDYAVVPCPLYDTEQAEYYSYYGNPTSFWGIPSNANIDDSAALLESLAADAYVFISPALFERALKIKYVTGEVDGLSKMFDIIREGLVFDACMFYKTSGVGEHYKDFSEIADSVTSWTNNFRKMKLRQMEMTMESIVAQLRSLNY